jgi:hypothetical protein
MRDTPSFREVSLMSLPFFVKSNGPTVVEVEGPDGEKYELVIRLMIGSVTHDETPPVSNAMPVFRYEVQLSSLTRKAANFPAG